MRRRNAREVIRIPLPLRRLAARRHPFGTEQAMISSLLIFATILIAQAPDESADDLNDATRRLVRQLDARQLTERDSAERELIELGPAVLDLLPSPSPRMPAETVQRLARIRRTLERRRAESIALGSSITHEQAERKLSEWFETLEQQTGNKIVDFRDQFGQQADDPIIELAFDETPFWNALDALLDHANLDVYPFAGESAVAVVGRAAEQTDRAARASYAGSFRLEPLEMFARRDLRNSTVHTLRLRLRASWEPKLRPIAIRQSMADLKAFGPDDEPLETVGQQAPREIILRPDAIATDLDIPLEPPARDIDRIARLEGTFQLLLPAGPRLSDLPILPRLAASNNKKAASRSRSIGSARTILCGRSACACGLPNRPAPWSRTAAGSSIIRCFSRLPRANNFGMTDWRPPLRVKTRLASRTSSNARLWTVIH